MKIVFAVIIAFCACPVLADSSDLWPGATYPDMCERNVDGDITRLPNGGDDNCRTYASERYMKMYKFGLCTQNVHYDEFSEFCDFIFDDPNGVSVVGKYQTETQFPGVFDTSKLSSEKNYTYAIALFDNVEQGISSLQKFSETRQSSDGSTQGPYCWTTGLTGLLGAKVHCGTLSEADPQKLNGATYIFGSQYDGSPQMIRNWEDWGYNELLDENMNLAALSGRYAGSIGDVSFNGWDDVDASTSSARFWFATRKLASDIQILPTHTVLKIGIGVSEASWLYQTDDAQLNGTTDCTIIKCVTGMEVAGFDMTAIIR